MFLVSMLIEKIPGAGCPVTGTRSGELWPQRAQGGSLAWGLSLSGGLDSPLDTIYSKGGS